MVKVLSHFTKEDFTLDLNHRYRRAAIGKPYGFWLSDESDKMGWKRWCEENNFLVQRLAFEKKFILNLADILVLDTDAKIIEFSELYQDEYFSVPGYGIKWNQIAETYKGILISPYSWKMRNHLDVLWYYSWDCASACVWDLSCLKPFSVHKSLKQD